MSSSGPLLLIVSSPSGAGKTTLTSRLRQHDPGSRLQRLAHHAPPALGREGRPRVPFHEPRNFEKLIELNEFLEWAEVHGNLYGTTRAELDRASGARGVIFDIDHQGARQIKSAKPDAVTVFILPPSMDDARSAAARSG